MYHTGKYQFEKQPYRQKLYSSLKSEGFLPEKDSEIYVSGIPPSATIHDLLNFFEPQGNIFQIKLMTKTDGLANRGFAYVTYMNKSLARKAISALSNVPFMGHFLSMQLSLDNCRLFIGGIPVCKSKDEIWHALKRVYKIDNIMDIIVYRNYANPAHNRGFIFVEFRTHEETAYFRAKYKNKLHLFGLKLYVDWAIPVVDRQENNIICEVKILFLRNLDVLQTSEDFARQIYHMMNRNVVEKVYKFKDYAYIHLVSREVAEELMDKLKSHYRGTVVEISFAKPPNKFSDRYYRDRALVSRRIGYVSDWSQSSANKREDPVFCSDYTPSSPYLLNTCNSSTAGSTASSYSSGSNLYHHKLSMATQEYIEAQKKLVSTPEYIEAQNKLSQLYAQKQFVENSLARGAQGQQKIQTYVVSPNHSPVMLEDPQFQPVYQSAHIHNQYQLPFSSSNLCDDNDAVAMVENLLRDV